MEKCILGLIVLASFAVNAANNKITTIDNIQCENGMSASITSIIEFTSGGTKNEIIASLRSGEGEVIQQFDTGNSDMIGFVILNDVNKTAVNSLTFTGNNNDFYTMNWSKDDNNHLDASVRIQFHDVVKCKLEEAVSSI
ncbi:hypothetical protein [Leclercia adecarboxylata]|uniref:hypothetical protein n=1 Tax=Leclercia adecarboxylata TaxID=83655 RepID=UPI002449C7D7|nr:hypothetical protein [Leclercia adecarboxylata]MDH0062455.1 hypothetical protein [Leclercia adecarboxylata]